MISLFSVLIDESLVSKIIKYGKLIYFLVENQRSRLKTDSLSALAPYIEDIFFI